MEWIYSIINEKEAMLLIDEIYSLYSYETDIKEILQPYYAKKNVVVFTGFSKGYAATGLRLGCVACHDQALIKRMNIIHQNSATCANTLAQYAFVDYGDVLSEAKYFSEYYLGNRDMVCEIIPEFNQFKPSGGFYYFINLEKFGITDGDVFAKELLEKTKVAVVPGSAYGEGFNSWIRISYSIDKLLLAEGLQILKKYISNHG
jgi:aspartate/methionine/tyrosine aminotransferase